VTELDARPTELVLHTVGSADHGSKLEASRVLIVDDNPGDVRLMLEGLAQGGLKEVHVAEDGEHAIAWLRGGAPDGGRPQLDLVLLDLNLPRMNGNQVLAEVKGDPDLRRTPIVVFTSSAAPSDVKRAYDLHANCYVNKPIHFRRLVEVLQAVEILWLEIAELPGR
jgi:two-component system, chemotaxis family, response regulator Rcp1